MSNGLLEKRLSRLEHIVAERTGTSRLGIYRI
jgi:hypothetical protein